MFGRIIKINNLKHNIYADIKCADGVFHVKFDKNIEPRPHTNDIVEFTLGDIDNEEKLLTYNVKDINLTETCKTPNNINDDIVKIISAKNKFETIADEHFCSIKAIKVRTPVLGQYKGTSNVIPFETRNKANKPLYLKFTHDFLLRGLVADLMSPVYEIGNVFRNMGISWRHANEYSMLESHIPGTDLEYGINFAYNIINDFAMTFGCTEFQNMQIIDIRESFRQFGADFNLMSFSEQTNFFKNTIKKSGKTFASKYQPVDVAPLAIRNKDENLALDAEIIYKSQGVAHIYVANNNYEQNIEIFKKQNSDTNAFDKTLLNKLKAGMPPNIMVAIGIDRLIASLYGVSLNEMLANQKLVKTK